ncbi:MAG TPA: DUF2169 domain-containing protein, partial [Candidatus Nanopelagicales bacterium]|nr:DUF2169 domain-containing protein [Candidatus Nanopelagicales bacterium]
MEVVSTCPLRVAAHHWQPRAGMWALSLACKATFRLTPGVSELAPQQEHPGDADNHWNDDPSRSLYAPSDLVPFKVRADVLLVGHAFAPRGEPTRSLIARLVVGEVDKSIEVWCDRSWSLEGQLREGTRFARMPLRYERAGGGPDTSNPVGMRPDAADTYGAVAIPNLQPPGMHLTRRGDAIPPIGFGPIAPTWPSRLEKLHHHAGAFLQSGGRLAQPLPEGIDLRFFNAAPGDQQLDELRSDARLVLENLHPQHPRLVTGLPGTSPRAALERPGAPPEEVRLACDTLWIDTDRGICSLVWRGQVTLDRPNAPGRVVISLDSPTSSRAWMSPAALPDRTRDDAILIDSETTYEPNLAESTVLPFAPAP